MNASITQRIEAKVHDLGGFTVRRLLPQAVARTIGPFVFFDHMGPAEFAPGIGVDVRPHPHIGLATVTYLFEGAIGHRDNLGSEQIIRPGDVNWMTAGSGIVHSERTPPAERAAGHVLDGLQIWIALPHAAQEVAPEFHHHPAASLPVRSLDGVHLRLIAGEALGMRSPVRVFSPMFYLAAEFDAGCAMVLPAEFEERAVYAIDADLEVDGETLAQGAIGMLAAGREVSVRCTKGGRAVLFGGAPLDGERHVFWNFVSDSRERIETAKQDWLEKRFAPVPGETEFIPLPSQ